MSFTSFPLDTLSLPREMLDAANKANLTTSSILLSSIPKLADVLKCKIPFAQALVRSISQSIADKTTTRTVEEMYTSRCTYTSTEKGKSKFGMISTGDEGFDRCLGGGLRRGCLYEIAGESAAGKSHLALTLALAAQLPSLSSPVNAGGALILTSERELSTDRLVTLSRSLRARHEPELFTQGESSVAGAMRERELLDNVITNRIADVDALEHALMYAIPALLEARRRTRVRDDGGTGAGGACLDLSTGPGDARSRSFSSSASGSGTNTKTRRLLDDSNMKPIRLIILDSITALFRGGSSTEDKPTAPSSLSLTERSKRLCGVADQLKAIATQFDLTVVVINQVSDVFTRQRLPTQGSQPSSSFINSTQREPYTNSNLSTEAGAGVGSDAEPIMLYSNQARWFSGQSENLNKEASLGIVWANAVNVRIMLSRTGRRRMLNLDQDQNGDHYTTVKRRRYDEDVGGDFHLNQDGKYVQRTFNTDDYQPQSQSTPTNGNRNGEDVKPTLIRKMHLVFSPFSPSSTIDYVITSSGVHSLPESYKPMDIMGKVMKRRQVEERERVKEQRYQLGMASQVQVQGEEEAEQGEGEDEEEEDVFDDFGELPPEFWAFADAVPQQAQAQTPSGGQIENV